MRGTVGLKSYSRIIRTGWDGTTGYVEFNVTLVLRSGDQYISACILDVVLETVLLSGVHEFVVDLIFGDDGVSGGGDTLYVVSAGHCDVHEEVYEAASAPPEVI